MSISNNRFSAQALEDYFNQLLSDGSDPSISDDCLPSRRNDNQLIPQAKVSTITNGKGLAPPLIDVNLSHVAKLFEKLPEVDDAKPLLAVDNLVDISFSDEKNAIAAQQNLALTDGFATTSAQPESKIEAIDILYFEVRGIIYAALLSELGGIYRFESLSPLLGQPAWLLGVHTTRALNVVDIATWVMGSQDSDMEQQKKYHYVIRLGDSAWGVACDNVLGAEVIHNEQIRWRLKPVNRPWLSGVVKHKMCILLSVNSLVSMLNQGIDAAI